MRLVKNGWEAGFCPLLRAFPLLRSALLRALSVIMRGAENSICFDNFVSNFLIIFKEDPNLVGRILHRRMDENVQAG